MKKRKFPWAYAIFGLLMALSLASVIRALAAEKPTAPREADAKKSNRAVAPSDDEKLFVPEGHWVSGQGVIEPRDRETKMAPSVGGRIARVAVKEGDTVKKGDIVAELDSDVEQAELDAAKADLDQANAELSRSLAGDRAEDRAAADAEARAADAKAHEAESILERTKRAATGGGATADEVDRAAREAEAQRASADLSRARYAAAQHGSRGEDIAAARAKVDGSKARFAEASARREQRIVRSPIDGEILSVKVRAGEYVQPGGDPVAIVGDTSVLRVRVDVDERDLAKLALGARVLVRVAALPGVDIEGKVVELGKRMGRKNVRSDDPVERNDAKILEVVAELGEKDRLVVGQRVVAFVATPD